MPVPSSELLTPATVTMDTTLTSQGTTDLEEEVMGTPGRVRDMIALFSPREEPAEINGNLPPKSPKLARTTITNNISPKADSINVLKSPRIPRSASMRNKITNWERGIFSDSEDNENEDRMSPGPKSPSGLKDLGPDRDLTSRQSRALPAQNDSQGNSSELSSWKKSPLAHTHRVTFEDPDSKLNSSTKSDSTCSSKTLVTMTATQGTPVAMTTNGHGENLPIHTNGMLIIEGKIGRILLTTCITHHARIIASR